MLTTSILESCTLLPKFQNFQSTFLIYILLPKVSKKEFINYFAIIFFFHNDLYMHNTNIIINIGLYLVF